MNQNAAAANRAPLLSGRRTISVIGGGVYVPILGELLARAMPSAGGTLRVSARRRDRLSQIAGETDRRMKLVSPAGAWRARASETIDEALDGADDIVLLIRVGGLTARGHDERFPATYGLVGDEGLGVGGIANAYRTIPIFQDLVARIRRYAPRARVWNMVAPLGVTTRVFLEGGIDAVGVCELPLVTLERFAAAAAVSPGNVRFEYAGVNHLGWFWNMRAGGQDLLPHAVRAGLLDDPTLAEFRAAPLHYYYEIFDTTAAKRLCLRREPNRAAALSAISERALETYARGEGTSQVALERATPWFDRALVPLLVATAGGQPFEGFLNVRNGRQDGLLIDGLPAHAVVEVPGVLDAVDTKLTRCAALPPPVATFLTRVVESDTLSYEAGATRSTALVRQAIEALPLSIPRADALDQLVDAVTLPIET